MLCVTSSSPEDDILQIPSSAFPAPYSSRCLNRVQDLNPGFYEIWYEGIDGPAGVKKDEQIGFLNVNEVARFFSLGLKTDLKIRGDIAVFSRVSIVANLNNIHIVSHVREILFQIYNIGFEEPVEKELHKRPVGNQPLHEPSVPEH